MAALQRSQQHRMLAGVIGGVADYYGWNTTVLRLVFVLVSIFSATVPGILIYLILWVLMPNSNKRDYA